MKTLVSQLSFFFGERQVRRNLRALVGEGAEFFSAGVPATLAGRTLGESSIGERTGLIVIAVEDGAKTVTNPPSTVALAQGQRLMMLGTAEQRQVFATEFD